jgi:hypothetical protein
MLAEKQRFLGKEIEASSVRNKLKPLKLLLEMNDVNGVNWREISRMMPRAPQVRPRQGADVGWS